MTDAPTGNRPDELEALLDWRSVTMPLVAPVERSAALAVAVGTERPRTPSSSTSPSGVLAFTCSERLPRDVLVRLAALSRQVGDIRQEHAACPGLALRLDHVATNLAALVQSIYDETVLHLTGRRR